MLFKSKQPPNASSSIFVTLLGIATLVKLVQANAPYPMLLTLPGIVTFVKLFAAENAASSILVTLFGIVNEAAVFDRIYN